MNLIWNYIDSFYSGKKTYITAFLITEFIGIGFLTPALLYSNSLWLAIPFGGYVFYHFYLFPYILNNNFFEPIDKWETNNSSFGKLMRYLTEEHKSRRTFLLYAWMAVSAILIFPNFI